MRGAHKIGTLCIILGILVILSAGAVMIHTAYEESVAQSFSQDVVTQMIQMQSAPSANTTPDSATSQQAVSTETAQSTVEVDGKTYIGLLEIPSLSLVLPIQENWSYAALSQTPCVYTGSLKNDNLIIIAHNYQAHFGTIHQMELGEVLSIYATDGTLWQYQLVAIDTLSGTDGASLQEGTWDLSLVTCLYADNSLRTALRLNRITP